MKGQIKDYIKDSYLYKKLRYIYRYFHGIYIYIYDKNKVVIQTPQISTKVYKDNIKIYPYWWFAACLKSSNYLDMNKGFYVYSPTFAISDIKNLTYDNYFSSTIRSAERALIRKAIKYGFTCREICYDDYLNEILEINTSKDQRMGKAMTYDYTHLCYRDKVMNIVGARVHTYGCFSADNKLVAYYMFEKISNFYLVVKGIGHKDYLSYGVMNQLFAYSLSMLSNKAECQYILYGTMSKGSTGLDQYKKHVGLDAYHIEIPCTKETKKIIKYMMQKYEYHDDISMNYVLDYVMNQEEKKEYLYSR